MSISPLMPVYPRCGVRPVRGDHCHLIEEDGTRYLDFASGIAVNLLGHSHEGLIGAIQRQAETLMHVSNLYGSPQGEALAQRLTGRGSDAPEVIERRLAAAREEIGHLREFDFVIINNILSQALDEMVTVARAARLLRSSQMARHPEFFQSLGVN